MIPLQEMLGRVDVNSRLERDPNTGILYMKCWSSLLSFVGDVAKGVEHDSAVEIGDISKRSSGEDSFSAGELNGEGVRLRRRGIAIGVTRLLQSWSVHFPFSRNGSSWKLWGKGLFSLDL